MIASSTNNHKPKQALFVCPETKLILDKQDFCKETGAEYICQDFQTGQHPNTINDIHYVLVITQEYLNNHVDSIHHWLSSDPSLMTRLIVLNNDSIQEIELPTQIVDNIALELAQSIKNKQLKKCIDQIFFGIQMQFENLTLSSKLALSSEDLRRITEVSQALSTEKDYARLIDLLMEKALELVSADSGSIYLTEIPTETKHPTQLRFVRSSMQDADEFLLPIDKSSIAGNVALTNKPLIIKDVHFLPEDADFSFNSEFDQTHNYYTKSMMVIPMTNFRGDVIGVLQLINRKKNFHAKLTAEQMKGNDVIEFSQKDYELGSAIAGQAAVAFDNQRLLDGQKKLLESFINLIANAIDSKSAYTGGHCERVPILTEMLAQAVCESRDQPFKEFDLNEEEWYELRIAAGLHDCGKIVTPVHVMDKSTKLQTIFDRIELIQTRIEILKRDAIIQIQKSIRKNPENEEMLMQQLSDKLDTLKEYDDFLVRMNVGGEMLLDEDIQKITEISKMEFTCHGKSSPLLTEEEVYNLSVRKGTLTKEERLIINGHMVDTIKMLESLPFPPNLLKVPEYAGGHHEKMDGLGYPKGIYAGDMSIPARIMVIADVFEALTATDRPYKKGKALSETMRIMGFMKKDNHLDPDLFNLFITSGTYLKYAKNYMQNELIDEVNENELINIQPKEFELPDRNIRQKCHDKFLPEYENIRSV